MIAFSGIDGAGKSTQIELLKKVFLAQGLKVQVFWSRGGYTPGMERLKEFFRKFKNSKIPQTRGNTEERKQSFSKLYIRKTWLTLAIVDLLFYYSVYIRFNELLGTKVICDRYLYDTLIDFKLNFPQEQIEKWWLWKFLVIIMVKPKKHFVLTIPIDESQRRSKLKKEPFPDSKKVLQKRRIAYLDFVSNNKNVVHLDGTLCIKVIHAEILKEINE